MAETDGQAAARAHAPIPGRRSSYAASGVDTEKEESGLALLIGHLEETLATRPAGQPGHVMLPFGYFANVIDLGGVGLAISTDGVGTKVLVAQMLDRYDTIGIDCIAMNVNDLLCVGAEPLCMVDYLAVQELRPGMVAEIARGLKDGAVLAGITIPAGEIAQVRDLIRGIPGRPPRGFDLAGTAVGTVALDRILIGQRVEADDVVLGLRSSGVHSNGLTLARRLFRKHRPDTALAELGRTLGEELLAPTRIYVREVLEVLRAGVDVKALIHVTSDGFLNLLRVANREIGYVLHALPEPPPIFGVIQREANVSTPEMYRVYNMGIGFCLVVSHRGDHAARALEILERHGAGGSEIGRVVTAPRQAVVVERAGLIGEGSRFRPLRRRDAGASRTRRGRT
jgi:phosphoribosylformylglycinamidine cyclo-ligase